jgi:homoserine dehydrogenase
MLIDYEGSDAAQKIALVAATVFGVDVNYLRIYSEGLSDLTPFDIECASRYDYEIKHLAVVRDTKAGLELRVHPTLVPKHHPLTSVENEYIAYYIRTDEIGELMVYGKGAGVYPAVSIIFRDLVDLATSIKTSTKYMYEFPMWNDKPVVPINEINSGYYIRFPCVNIPGVIGKITTVIGTKKININSAHASVESNDDNNIGYVHIFVDNAKENNILQAIEKVKNLKVITGIVRYFRILNEQVL